MKESLALPLHHDLDSDLYKLMSSSVTHPEPSTTATTNSTSFPPPQISESLNAAQTGWESNLPDAARVRLGVMRRIHLAVNGMGMLSPLRLQGRGGADKSSFFLLQMVIDAGGSLSRL